METKDEINREARLRKLLHKEGYRLRKSRIRTPNGDNLGGYMILDGHSNSVMAGDKYQLDLDQVAEFIK